jgi:hypothetical protein
VTRPIPHTNTHILVAASFEWFFKVFVRSGLVTAGFPAVVRYTQLVWTTLNAQEKKNIMPFFSGLAFKGNIIVKTFLSKLNLSPILPTTNCTNFLHNRQVQLNIFVPLRSSVC